MVVAIIITFIFMLFTAFFICQCMVRQNEADKALEDMEQETYVTAYLNAKKNRRREQQI